jgi:hypothetical protein
MYSESLVSQSVCVALSLTWTGFQVASQAPCLNFTVVINSAPDFSPVSITPTRVLSQSQCCAACNSLAGCNMWRVQPTDSVFDPNTGLQCLLYIVPHGTKLRNLYPQVSFTGIRTGDRLVHALMRSRCASSSSSC